MQKSSAFLFGFILVFVVNVMTFFILYATGFFDGGKKDSKPVEEKQASAEQSNGPEGGAEEVQEDPPAKKSGSAIYYPSQAYQLCNGKLEQSNKGKIYSSEFASNEARYFEEEDRYLIVIKVTEVVDRDYKRSKAICEVSGAEGRVTSYKVLAIN